MNLTNMEDMKTILEWAKENEDEDVYNLSDSGKSYYRDKDTHKDYIMPYSFLNIAQLKRYLEEYIELDEKSEIFRVLLARISQARYRIEQTQKERNNDCSFKEDEDKTYVEPKGTKLSEVFSKWAERNEDNGVFANIVSDISSYYVNRNSKETYIMQYMPANLMELSDNIKEYSGLSADSPMFRTLVVEICTNMRRGGQQEPGRTRVEKNEELQINEHTLPEHIYFF